MNRNQLHAYTDPIGVLYVQPKQIAKTFSISRATVHNLLTGMKKIPKYKKSFLDLSFHLKLVKLADFEKYLQEIDRQYLKE